MRFYLYSYTYAFLDKALRLYHLHAFFSCSWYTIFVSQILLEAFDYRASLPPR